MTRPPFFDIFFHAMPLVFTGSGVLMMLTIRSWPALVSGAFLIGFAGFEQHRRIRLRRNRDAAENRYRLKLASILPPAPTPVVNELVWDTSLESGHPTIDAQHQALLAIVNKLIVAVQEQKSRAHTEFLLDALIENISDHFAYEEVVMARTNFPLASAHRDRHVLLVKKSNMLCAAYKRGYVDIHQVLAFMTEDVLEQHILREDSALFPSGG